MSRVLVSAADASGDLHAAEFVEALRRRRPKLAFFGVGGRAMEEAGVELVVAQRELAVAGLVEVLGSVRRFVAAWRRVAREIAADPPGLAVLVDAPDFHLPLARRLRRAGVPVLYYVSPQVWAWRRYRVRKLARRVDRMAVIFPFEVACYAGTGLRVEFVGHPLVDRLARVAKKTDQAQARRELGMELAAPWVLLLPGSRRNELRHAIGLHLAVAEALQARRPEVRFALGLAPTLAPEDLDALVSRAGGTRGIALRVIRGRTHLALRAADVALAKPGTVTLEATLLGCPLVVAGRAHVLSAAVLRRLVRVPWFAMPNLVAGAPVVPEFLQEQARPERVAEAVEALLEGPARELQLARLAEVARRLGPGGAAERTAAIAEEMLGASAAAA